MKAMQIVFLTWTAELVSESTTDFGESGILILALLGARIVGHQEGCVHNQMMQTALSDTVLWSSIT